MSLLAGSAAIKALPKLNDIIAINTDAELRINMCFPSPE
jgi:hypothetical protein